MKTFDANIIVYDDADDDFDTLGEVGFKLQMGITLAPGTREPFQGWNFNVHTHTHTIWQLIILDQLHHQLHHN